MPRRNEQTRLWVIIEGEGRLRDLSVGVFTATRREANRILGRMQDQTADAVDLQEVPLRGGRPFTAAQFNAELDDIDADIAEMNLAGEQDAAELAAPVIRALERGQPSMDKFRRNNPVAVPQRRPRPRRRSRA